MRGRSTATRNAGRRVAAVTICLGAILGATHVHAGSALNVSGERLALAESSDIGASAAVGFQHTYADIVPAIGVRVDARVTVVAKTNLSISKLDDTTSDPSRNKDLEMETSLSAVGGNGEVTIEFIDEFGNALYLTGVTLHIKDIDDKQWVEFDGVSASLLAADTNLVSQSNAINPAVPSGWTRYAELNGLISSSSDEPHWAQVSFPTTNIITFRVGAEITGGADFNFVFTNAGWTGSTEDGTPSTTVPTTVPDSTTDSVDTPDRLVSVGGGADLWLVAASLMVALGVATVGVAEWRRRTRIISSR